MALLIHPKALTKIQIGNFQGSKAPTPSNSSKVSYNANLKHLPWLTNEESQLKAARWGECQRMARFLKLGQWIPNLKQSSTSNNYKIKFKEEYNQSTSGIFKTSSRLSDANVGNSMEEKNGDQGACEPLSQLRQAKFINGDDP